MPEPEKRLDARGLYCPEPVFRTKIEVERMQPGQVITVLADDPAAEDDISSWADRSGHEMLSVKRDGGAVEMSIKKR